MHAAAFVLGNMLVLSISFRCAELFLPDREPWRRILATVAGFPVIILAVVLILGSLGQLSAWMVVGVLAVMAGVLHLVPGRIDVPATSAMCGFRKGGGQIFRNPHHERALR